MGFRDLDGLGQSIEASAHDEEAANYNRWLSQMKADDGIPLTGIYQLVHNDPMNQPMARLIYDRFGARPKNAVLPIQSVSDQ